jgi:hypothetical protein
MRNARVEHRRRPERDAATSTGTASCADADRPSLAAGAVAVVPLAVACDNRADPEPLQSRPAIAR